MNYNVKKFKYLIYTVIIFSILLLTGCKKKIVFKNDPPIPENEITAGEITYYEAQKTTIEKSVTIKGICYPYEQTPLMFKTVGGEMSEYLIADDQEVKKGDVIMVLDDEPMRENLYVSEKQMEKYMLSYNETMQNYSVNGGNEYSYKKTQIDLKLQQMSMDKLYEELGNYTLTAPVSGVIYERQYFSQGQYISPYTIICYIVNKDDLIILYNGSNAEHFRIGNIVDLSFTDSEKNKIEFKGKVIITPNDLPEGNNDYNDIIAIKPLNTPDGLKIDSSVTINYTYEKRENVIVIQKSVIKNLGTKSPYVYVLREDGQMEKRDVEIGISNATEAEIISGIFEGEKIAG